MMLDDFTPQKNAISYEGSYTASRFILNDDNFVIGLMGCVGCGKTVACCMKIYHLIFQQVKNSRGIRYSKVAIVRNTYQDLKDTTIATWKTWFPEDIFGKIRAPKEGGFVQEWNFPAYDVKAEIVFLALDKEKDVRKLDSRELTLIWFNELRYIPKKVFEFGTMRVGRGVPPNEIRWAGVLFDTNPPDDDSWIHEVFEDKAPKDYKMYKYPPGVIPDGKGWYKTNPRAENLKNLKSDYYERGILGKSHETIKVMYMGEYGNTEEGRPVYPMYNDSIHLAEHDIEYDPFETVYLGFDAGRNISCVITQFVDRQVRVLEEVVGVNTDAREFCEDRLLPLLKTKYPECNILSIIDPSAKNRSAIDSSYVSQVLNEYGLNVELCETNDIDPRLGAVKYFLRTILNDGSPAFLLDKSASVLRKGMNGRYKLERVKSINGDMYKDIPDKKNGYSDVQDALQYICYYLYNDLLNIGQESLDIPLRATSSPRNLQRRHY